MEGSNCTVLFVTPEIVPYRATGGLADVAEALPAALIEEGYETIRIMPKYAGIEKEFALTKQVSFIVEVGEKATVADIYKIEENGVKTYFVGSTEYFEREKCYGYDDDDIRFGFFCKASMEMLILLDIKPDIIHLNDWQTALIGLFLKEEYSNLDFYKNMKVVFTIHNLQYQGVFGYDALEKLNLPSKYFHPEKVEYFGKTCYMKAGIVYADLVSTVSETYAKEIQTHTYGYGLDGLLRKYTHKLCGILNGIYYSKYDPAIDPTLVNNFDEKNFYPNRKENKAHLQKELGLPVSDAPLFGVVTRFAEQKGIELIYQAIKSLIKEEAQFVILGTGEPEYEKKMSQLSAKYPSKVKVVVQFDGGLARQIYGSSDFFLMPSLFEPCGLSQLYSLRYGAVPVVRETGGLMDTITDYSKDATNGTGFTFKNFTTNEFLGAIYHALDLYKDQEKMKELIARDMSKRFTWNKAAKEYIVKYEELLNKK